MTELGDLVTRFTVDTSGLQEGVTQYGFQIDALQNKMSEYQSGLSDIGDTTEETTKKTGLLSQVSGGLNATLINLSAGIFVAKEAINAIAGAYGATIGKTLEYAEAVEDASNVTGVSIENIQRWRQAATAVGADAESVAYSLRMLTQNISHADDKSTELGKTFAKLGLTAKDASGHFKDTNSMMWEMLFALKDIPDVVERNRMAMQTHRANMRCS